MLRLIDIDNKVPSSFQVRKDAEFQPGFIGQLYEENGEVVIGVSNGSSPVGILDDIKTSFFTSTVWDEKVNAKVLLFNIREGVMYSQYDTVVELANSNIDASSFVSMTACTLNAEKGVIVFPPETKLDADQCIKTSVRYSYKLLNIFGDDSTSGTGQAVVWTKRGIFATDIYETTQSYPLNANLYVSVNGKLTTKRELSIHPAVGTVVKPPSAKDSNLRFMWM